MENYSNDDIQSINNNSNNNSKNELEITDLELENNIEILQNAIALVKSERKKLNEETDIIYKRINFLKQKEKQIKTHCRQQIEQLHKTVEIKKKRLQDEILLEQKKNNNLNSSKNKKNKK